MRRTNIYLCEARQDTNVTKTVGVARRKLTSRVGLLRQLAGSSLGAATKTLLTATLALVHSIAKCFAPAWCCSNHKSHERRTTQSNSLLRLTPTDELPLLAGIEP